MLIEVSRGAVAWMLPTLDLIGCLLFFYLGMSLTKDFGFSSPRERVLFVHRLLLMLTSIAFLYHSIDIWEHPEIHGLTLSNFALHICFIAVVAFSSVRITRSEHRLYRNGDALTGPNMRSNNFH